MKEKGIGDIAVQKKTALALEVGQCEISDIFP